MSARILRKKVPTSYCEFEEPAYDEYVYCEKCGDFVYEYCSLHGPLLVVPDEKVPNKPEDRTIVPSAALTIPGVFLHLAVSVIPGAGIGVFSSLTLPRGVRFGPYKGKITKYADSNYCWQIYDKNRKPSHVVDAVDSNTSNWMRYVNCARNWAEQNLVAYQYKGELYYRTIKIIPKYTELLVFYGSKYAQELQIDVAKYNCNGYYYEIIGKVPDKTSQVKTIEISQTYETALKTNKDLEIQDSIEDNFQYIDKQSPMELITLNFDDNIELINSCVEDSQVVDKENAFNYQLSTVKNETNIHNEIIYECDVCFKYKTKVKRYLHRHKLIHGEIKRYKCLNCNYQINSKSNYDRHVASHTNELNFRCDICTYATYSKHNLTNHVKRVHNKEKTLFYCTHCPYKNRNKSIVDCHMKRHYKPTVLKCEFCYYICEGSSKLKKHVLRHENNGKM